LGWAIIGGLTVSQILTLFTTPVIYIYLDRVRSWLPRTKALGRVAGHGGQGDVVA
jgi:hypothetical protein